MNTRNPFRPVDETARELALDLIAQARFAALAVVHPDNGLPSISRIALAADSAGWPLTLISDLAEHSRALEANPACALLIGEPADKGDPLTHPRLTLHCTARPIPRATEEHTALRASYLSQRPKAGLYIDFADFRFVRFEIVDGLLNGGFGKAWKMTREDLCPPSNQRTT
ncbi:HugZ family protein [Ruegeria arenilitoris]|uniref:HugZ family pyridoxamine 5'-phosphate oxidase n=1 Tax=Ruegeria arenilitoris TaxID=1173585 RepID=UPI00147A82F3